MHTTLTPAHTRARTNTHAHGLRCAQVPQGSAHGFRSMKRIKCYYPNTVVNLVKAPPWQALLLRLGAADAPRRQRERVAHNADG